MEHILVFTSSKPEVLMAQIGCGIGAPSEMMSDRRRGDLGGKVNELVGPVEHLG